MDPEIQHLRRMKRFLAIPIALSTLGAMPVQAGSVWLIIKEAVKPRQTAGSFGITLEKLEMESMDQCEEQGAIFMASERMGKDRVKFSGFECLEGK